MRHQLLAFEHVLRHRRLQKVGEIGDLVRLGAIGLVDHEQRQAQQVTAIADGLAVGTHPFDGQPLHLLPRQTGQGGHADGIGIHLDADLDLVLVEEQPVDHGAVAGITKQHLADGGFQAVVRSHHRVQVDRRVLAANLVPVVQLALEDLAHLHQAQVGDRIAGMDDEHQRIPGHRMEYQAHFRRADRDRRARRGGQVDLAAEYPLDARVGTERSHGNAGAALLGVQAAQFGDAAGGDIIAAQNQLRPGRRGRQQDTQAGSKKRQDAGSHGHRSDRQWVVKAAAKTSSQLIEKPILTLADCTSRGHGSGHCEVVIARPFRHLRSAAHALVNGPPVRTAGCRAGWSTATDPAACRSRGAGPADPTP